MTLKRVMTRLEASHLSVIRTSRLTKIFVWADIFCFWIQGGAASLQAIQSSPIVPLIGKWTVVGGLVLQLVIFGFFIVVAGKFHKAILESPTSVSRDESVRWKAVMRVLYVTSALIFVRNTVRIAEYVEGYTGWIITHEVMLFVFDAALMWVLVAVMYFWHPSELLGGLEVTAVVRDEESLSDEGKGSVEVSAMQLLPAHVRR
jgi:hypothetical protein